MPTSSSVQEAKKAFGTRLRESRREAGLTTVALAADAGWHRTKVSKLESAATSPSADDLRAWCRICGAEDQYPELPAKLIATETMWTDWRRLERAGPRQAQETVVQPVRSRFGLTVSAEGQTVWLDTPSHIVG
ncbi:helix-turn-helix domain-containing protein [Spirillospora sp. NPDC048911]|uniref:helix-turn-helix domain-containing protein n=1 Tax=Spirillospora sp. NPDC048911 TaxID=3364527 RepID=UPI0037115696